MTGGPLASTESSILLTPTSIGPVSVRNRIVSTAHSTRYTSAGIPTDRYLKYQEEKARGGVGLITVGGSAVVSRESAPAFGNIAMYKKAVVPALADIVAACHRHGSKVFIQLTHLGRRTDDHSADWLPTVSSASMREPAHRSYPKQAESWDLDRIEADFVVAAEHAREAGLDGIELEHYGHLLDAFASPWHLANLPEDKRAEAETFPLRVIRAVKKVTRDDMALGVRMSVDERREGGLSIESAVILLQNYIDAGIDFVNVIVGTIESQSRMTHVIPGAGKRSAPFLETVAQIKRAVKIPVIHAAKIDEISTAEHALESGVLDLVGMTRANIADPHLVKKLAEGRSEEIRPCVGARYCLEGGATGGVVCFHNPAVGREATLFHEITHRAPAPRRVVIVGAGPAGLEAAHVAAKLGHKVTLFEAASGPGGQLGTVARLERKRDFAGALDWRMEQARLYGVKFEFGVFADEADILALEPDVVILATGGVPREADAIGIDGSRFIDSIWELFERPVQQRQRTLIFDDEGRYASLDALELLAKTSDRVTYVTPERTVGIDVGSLNFADYQAEFDKYSVEYKLSRRLNAVSLVEDRVLKADLMSDAGQIVESVECDQIFYAGGTWPNDELYEALCVQSSNQGRIDQDAFIEARPQPAVEDAGFRLYRLGDAVSSRNVHAAFVDAHRIALGI